MTRSNRSARAAGTRFESLVAAYPTRKPATEACGMNKISVRQSTDRLYWWVTFGCCDAPPLRFHDWTLAMQTACTHQHSDSSLSESTPEDARITAWNKIADHPAFRPCFDSEEPLIDSMLARLDELAAAHARIGGECRVCRRERRQAKEAA